MRPLRPRGPAALGVCLLLWLAAAPTGAVVPEPPRIARAVAEASRDAGLAAPLLLDVVLRIGDGEEVVATGELVTHPTGLARLELNSRHGFVERHLLQGAARTATRDGVPLERPHHFLPPVFLLQARSGAALRAALASYGVAPEIASLGRIGDHDCYVLGGRTPALGGGEEPRRTSVWVDLRNYEVVRIDVPEARYQFGPTAAFGKIRAPSWITIETPGLPPARLEIKNVSRASAPAAEFGEAWLLQAPPGP